MTINHEFSRIGLLMIALLFTVVGGGAEAATATTEAFRLSIKHGGIRQSGGDEILAYSSQWDGDARATVTIAQDGVAIAEGLTGAVTVQWRAHLVRDVFRTSFGEQGSIMKLGKAPPALLDKTPPSLRHIIQGKGLGITKDLVTHVKKDSHCETDPRSGNVPLQESDLDLLLLLWRSPDRVEGGGKKNTLLIRLDALDGGELLLVASMLGEGVIATSLYKQKK